MFTKLEKIIDKTQVLAIPSERIPVLDTLVDYCQSRIDSSEAIKLNFICTHNSRRSQFSQVWAMVAAYKYGIHLAAYSGGIEVTSFNERAIASLLRFGFQVSSEGVENPHYKITFSADAKPVIGFSKYYHHDMNPKKGFAAVMTCSDADDNCPFIPGASARIPLRYDDPKAFDNTPEESDKYDERSIQIVSEMLYVFSKLKLKAS